MKKIFGFLLSIVLLSTATSCDSKRTAIDDMQDLATELEANGKEYTEEEWESAANKLVQIEEDMNNHEYTDDELREIGRLKARCAKEFMKSAAQSFEKGMKNMMLQLEGAAEEFQTTDAENITDETAE